MERFRFRQPRSGKRSTRHSQVEMGQRFSQEVLATERPRSASSSLLLSTANAVVTHQRVTDCSFHDFVFFVRSQIAGRKSPLHFRPQFIELGDCGFLRFRDQDFLASDSYPEYAIGAPIKMEVSGKEGKFHNLIPKDNCRFIERHSCGGCSDADRRLNDAGSRSLLSQHQGFFKLQTTKLRDFSEEVISLDFDSLNHAISQDDYSNARSFEQFPK